MDYNFLEVEKKWRKQWAADKTYKTTNDFEGEKCYVLDMFPYPSGAGLHVGHPLGYIASDIYARYKKLNGFNVLHPMGYDAFGLPAEQYAIQTGQHPKVTTDANLERYRDQLDKLGFSFDWDREIRTCEPNYYKWTQWIFAQLFKSWYNNDTQKATSIDELISTFEKEGNTNVQAACEETEIFTAEQWKEKSEKEQSTILLNYRLAYLNDSMVNWCPGLGTVLANDEVINGLSERGGHPVERKMMRQWSLRISAYAERLLQGLDQVDWTDSLKEMQKNWIGKSEGTTVHFKISRSPSLTLPEGKGGSRVVSESGEVLSEGSSPLSGELEGASLSVFTTRPDTIFGVSFMVIAPEHDYVEGLTTADQKEEVEAYVLSSKNKTERERMADVKNVTGVFTGSFVTHPFTGKQVPIWLGDYVLAGYGTGAVMAVAAHDSRDYAFAKKFDLPILPVIEGGNIEEEAYEAKTGKVINSDFLDGLKVKQAVKTAIWKIETEGLGKGQTNYRLRDAVFGRQRYWGEPIPMYFEDGIPKLLDESKYPHVLPEVDEYLPTEAGDPPLGRAINWYHQAPSNSPEGEERSRYAWETAGKSTYGELKVRADKQKSNPTDTEQALWEMLKGKKTGFKFRRQHVIGRNIVDFVCIEKMLTIEVDGKIHDSQVEYDQARTEELKGFGFTEVRFTNEQVIADTDQVLKEIEQKLHTLPSGKDLSEGSSPLSGELEGAHPYELSTMPGWAGSSWYYLRYMDPQNDDTFASREATDYWNQVDLYIGGTEHATGHLLYSRFWCKVLFDLGHVGFEEPFKKLINQGMILGTSNFAYRINGTKKFVSKGLKDKYDTTPVHVDVNMVVNDELDVNAFKAWRSDFADAEFELENGKYLCGEEVEKMSKSKFNVVNPDLIVEQHGADVLRMYEMFLGPLEQAKPWSTKGIDGVSKFIRKAWNLYHDNNGNWDVSTDAATKEELKVLHTLIKKVEYDVENFSFNTSVSAFMVCVNELGKLKCNKLAILKEFAIVLSPYAPFVTEELWSLLGGEGSVTKAQFPKFEASYLVESSHSYPVSFNGKMRFKIDLPLDLSKDEIEAAVLANEGTLKWLEGKTPKKMIVVPKKIVNVVI
ncbi:MAG: leucyl-tRNA synthetase [Glaciecola sp.]|jgi:leucyl-tRNA synthetase